MGRLLLRRGGELVASHGLDKKKKKKKKPSIANIDNRPFLISLIFNSENVSGSSARPNGSNDSPGRKASNPSPNGPPLHLYPSHKPIDNTWNPDTANID